MMDQTLIFLFMIIFSVHSYNILVPIRETKYVEWLIPHYTIDPSYVIASYDIQFTCECKSICRTRPNFEIASISKSPDPTNTNITCHLAPLDEGTITIPLVPHENHITFFTAFGRNYFLDNIGQSEEIKTLGGSSSTIYYYSLSDPKHMYWLLREKHTYQDSLVACQSYPMTHLAYFENNAELEIGRHVIMNERDGIPTDSLNRYYIHLDMDTKTKKSQLWYKNSTEIVNLTKFEDESKLVFNSQGPVYLNVLVDDLEKYFINDLEDAETFALCRTYII